MTNQSANRIRGSYKLLVPRMDQMTHGLYERIFAARPELRPLFQADMQLQQQHLAAALALIVRNLTMLNVMEVPFNQLGADHARAGVRPEHYSLFRDALLASMAASLEKTGGWTTDLADDWRRLLDQVSASMLNGALTV